MRKMVIKYVFFLLITSLSLSAQQESQFSHFMNNKMLYNPSYAGSRGVSSVTAFYRQQWIGYDGAPKSLLVNGDIVFKNDRVGLGVNAFNRRIGIFDENYGSIAYSYALINTNELNFRLGIHGALKQYTINLNKPGVFANEENDNSLITSERQSKLTGNFGIGAYLSRNEWYVGLAVPTLLNPRFGLNKDIYIVGAEEFLHAYLMGGAFVKISDDFHIKPQALIKYAKNAPIGLDANLSFTYDYRFTLGVSYRSGTNLSKGESIDALMFLQFNKLGIGAAYDFRIGQLKNTHIGSFELLMRYDFGESIGSNLTNPRYFF